MSEPFIGELKLVAFNFAPKTWTMSNGQILAINQNAALFSLLGTTFGGDGRVTFALPNLQGNTPVGINGNQGINLGQRGGEAAHTLTVSEIPSHFHQIEAAGTVGTEKLPGNMLAGQGAAVYTGPANPAAMNSGMLGQTGGSQPHDNMQPYLVMTWIIALQGIFPSRN